MKRLLLILSMSIFTLLVIAQVETRSFPNGNASDEVKVLQKRTKSSSKRQMPAFDVQEMLKEDLIVDEMGDAPYRFGKGFDVNYTLKDGSWSSAGDGRLWSMNIESQDAHSLNFVFNDFYLPEGAELYIVNAKGTVLYGPVTSKDIPESRFFLTDLIEGDNATIYLFEPAAQKDKSSLIIEKVVHAYRGSIPPNVSKLKAYNDAFSCHNDIVCHPEWSVESRAVALILLSDAIHHCSGALLNNEGFNPYLLTAFHCIDLENPRGELSTAEKSGVASWMFRFHFTRNTCGGSSLTSGISINGATFRAAWQPTDFALVEVNRNTIPYEGANRVAFLGWDRSGATSPNGTGIHHPRSDVMKISFDNHSIKSHSGSLSWTDGTSSSANTHWNVGFDNGTAEGGSSGSPLFNSNKKVIGQLHGGDVKCAPTTMYYGRLDKSWTGGGTNSTRLSNWLGTSATTTETKYWLPEQKIIKGSPNFVNRGERCYFSIDNYHGVQSINWLSNANMTLVSGQGTNAATYLVSNTALGSVTVEAILGSQTLRLSVPVFYRYFGGVSSFVYGQISPVILAGGTNSVPTWTYDTSLFDMISQSSPSLNVWNIVLKSKYNGSTAKTTTITVKQDGTTLSKVLTLNPSTKSAQEETITKNVCIYNLFGSKVYEEKNVINFNIENTNLGKGVYIIESIDDAGKRTQEKVMKTK